MDEDLLARAEATPAVVIDLDTVRKIQLHNRVMASINTLTGLPTQPIRSIQEWDELEARLGVLL